MNKKCIIKILIFVVLILLCGNSFKASADSNNNIKFSDNYYLVINESNIDFSQYNQKYIDSLINEVFDALDNDINIKFCYNYSLSQELAYQIKDFYYSYYSINATKKINEEKLSRYTLQDSSVQDANGTWNHNDGVWIDRYRTYNCYAFSINRYESDTYYNTDFQYQPGDFSDSYFSLYLSISLMADVVEQDLAKIGYSNINISDTPNYDLNDNQV